MKQVYKYLILLIFQAACLLHAQNPYAIELTKEKGLPSNTVYDIMEDEKGFIWIANNEGITRYDGKEFITYKSAKQTSYAGSCITEDRYGRIWYENFDGYIYYIHDDSLYALNQRRPVQYVPYGISNDKLFVMQEKGVDVYSLEKLTYLTTVPISVSEVEHACMHNQAYFVISSDTIFRIDNNLQVKKSSLFTTTNELVKQIYSQGDNLYILSKFNENKKLYKLNYELQLVETKKITQTSFIQSSDFIDTLFWINSTNGCFVYHTNGKFLFNIFSRSSVSCVIKDYQNNYWIGTTHEGIKIVPDLNNKLYITPDFISSRVVEFDNTFLIGTKTGDLYKISTTYNEFELLFSLEDKVEIYYLFYDSLEHKIYFSSRGFYKFNPKTKKVEDFKTVSVKEVYRLDSSCLALAVSGYWGILKTSRLKSIWDSVFIHAPYGFAENISKQMVDVRAKTLAYDKKNNRLYIGTNIGLFWKDANNHQGEIKKNKLPFYASQLIYTHNKLYALSTKGNLYRIDENHNFVLLNPFIGIPALEIKNIKILNDKLYILSNRNIYEYDIDKHTSRKITPAAYSFEISDYTIHNNKLIVLTKKGILEFSIEHLPPKISPRFYINSITAGGINLKPGNEIILTHTQKSISIHYSVLDYGERGYENMYYTINGSEKFSLPESANRLKLPMLAEGKYLIDFYLDGQKLSYPLYITILPPIWKRRWFNTLLSIAIIALIYLYYRYQNGLLQKKLKLLNEKVELEQNLHKSIMKTIKSQMNPHFFYNALNTIQAFIFTNDKAKANTYLAKFSKLTRLILEHSEKETITLAEEINTLQLYLGLEKIRFNNNFEYRINVDGITNKELIEIPPMLIQPYVENAIKHGLLHKKNERLVIIDFVVNENILTVTVDDNGIGRVKAEELNKIKKEKFDSFSTKANQKRLEIINRSLGRNMGVRIIDKYDQNNQPEGTRVILTIPIH